MIGQAPPSLSTGTTVRTSGQIPKPFDMNEVSKMVEQHSFKDISAKAEQELNKFNAKEFFENNKTLVYIGGALIAWMLLRK